MKIHLKNRLFFYEKMLANFQGNKNKGCEKLSTDSVQNF